VDEHPELHDKMGLDDLSFKKYGWEVHDFLDPVDIDDVLYSHYFPLNSYGQVSNIKNGCPNALAQAKRVMRSSVAGHKQGLDTAILPAHKKRPIRGIIAGSFYRHSEGYLGPGSLQSYWRGLLLFNDVHDGSFDLCEVSMDFLEKKYG
jgi:hypothetical protein